MPWATTGLFPTEFDPTIDRVLRSVQACGATDADIERVQHDLLEIMIEVSTPENVEDSEDEAFIAVMDCAFIGLVYHRHMPFIDPDDYNVSNRPTDDYHIPNTLAATMAALEHQVGIDVRDIHRVSEEGAALAIDYMDVADMEDGRVTYAHIQMVMLCNIGMLIHRLMPTSKQRPTVQLSQARSDHDD